MEKFGRISGALLRRLIQGRLPSLTLYETKDVHWLCQPVLHVRRGVSVRSMADRLPEAGCQARARAQQAAARNQVEAAKAPVAKGLGRLGRPVLSAAAHHRPAVAKAHRVVVCRR